MTAKQVIRESMKIAQDNGFEAGEHILDALDIWDKAVEEGRGYEVASEKAALHASIIRAIMSIPFAKSFFGEEEITDRDKAVVERDKTGCYVQEFDFSSEVVLDGHFNFAKVPAWKYHLQEMAITEDRITYLEEYLEDNYDL